MSQPATVTGALRQSFDWTGVSGRAVYATAFAAQILCLGAALIFAPTLPVMWVIVAVATFVFLGQMRRRMRDAGWRGGWMWVAMVPYLGFIPQLILLFRRSAGTPRRGENTTLRKVGWAVALAFCLLLAGRSSFYAPFWIPTGSMAPTLVHNDYLFSGSRFVTVARGDVVVFRHPVNGTDFVKRVIGLGGDTVQMVAGRVVLNGTTLPQTPAADFAETMERQGAYGTYPRCRNAPVALGETCLKTAAVETLPSGRSYTVLDIRPERTDDTEVVTVPDGHMFVLGDNRDNSADSRMPQAAGGIGTVPLENVKGRVRRVVFSLDGDPTRLFRRVP
ncbi:signal peptidase I [Tateyamaria sp. SN6-1]|uniref:signal peptidase I n=1 Tax=Tateyamaria sp. SN6-1 TaxID=3092148 RepID=UPI0039F57233